MAANTKGTRRTQEERSAATRGRLLDATIDCLVDYGYAGTTVARVAERAQVTRGAQVHHFPTKEQLVISAVRHLNQLRSHDTVERLDGLSDSGAWVDSLLEVLWESHRGAVFVATAEMWLAARTNPPLASHIGEVEEVVALEFTGGADAHRPAALAKPEVRDAVFTAMDAMRGLVMSSWHLPEAEVTARWHRLKKHLRLVFPKGV